ncbi:MAG: 4-alpha-glucanotransferase [Tannerella sp.]|jgi:4-alpha-glucanotransferase|nr:4-alpha-glucanotransferase [Tannerella sp.]
MDNILKIRVSAPSVSSGQYLAVTGNQGYLGFWDTSKALKMSDVRFPVWEICLNISEITFPMEYKFIVKDASNNELIYWEEGSNRVINEYKEAKQLIINTFPLREDLMHRWKAAGTVAPVFALRSENSFGIGDICDLKKLIDWAIETGQRIVQLLPMNDTTRTHTWRDSYPYSAISIYALHPLYISIPMLKSRLKKRKGYFEKIRLKLNALDTVDYQEVEKYKTKYLREYFAQERNNILNNSDFNAFINTNADWLKPYAVFSYLRDKFGTADFNQWGEYKIYNKLKINELCEKKSESYDEIVFIYFLQYTLDYQFKTVADHARANRILLKGDIPIGVNRESVETWTEPDCFNMQQQSGAPPDDFSDDGQNWSFPTYNWEVMEKDGFEWWKRRFAHLNRYFDCIRIDHILGFFRIWEIPVGRQSGLYGHFRPALPLSETEINSYGLTFSDNNAIKDLFLPDPYFPNCFHPLISAYKSDTYKNLEENEKAAFGRLHHEFFYVRHNEFWKETALKRLSPLTKSSSMIVCGEDLGMLPATVHEVMDSLQILTLELGRISKEYGKEFTDLNTLPYHSVCTTSTHDMNPVRAWWHEDSDRTQRYYNNILHREGKAPENCTPEIAEQIVSQHINSPSMLTVIPLQDWFAMDGELRCEDFNTERINVPANPENYWRYRMHITIEQLMNNKNLSSKVLQLCCR